MTPDDLRAWRQRLGFSQDAAAANLGCGRRSLQLWENGTNAIPRYVGLACMALEDGMSLEDELDKRRDMQKKQTSE